MIFHIVLIVWIQHPSQEIQGVLDQFHQAASRADSEAYFGCMTPDGVFIGTDATEIWTRPEFEAFCRPYFNQGKGWTYTPGARQITLHESGEVAWFVEALENSSYGTCRGSGVLVKKDGQWKIAQYHLTIPIPNGLTRDIVAMIRDKSH